MPINGFEQLERRRGDLARVAENSARLAYAYGTFDSTGLGQFAFPDRVPFNVGFVERPYMHYGYYCGLHDDDSIVLYPRSTGFVWDWITNAQGLYIGAHCGVCVDTPAVVSPPPSFQLEHYFTFSGVAMKMIPAELLDD